MRYEDGMNIRYEDVEGVLKIRFRGKDYEIRRKFPDQASAIRAGEQHCKMLGWGLDNRPS